MQNENYFVQLFFNLQYILDSCATCFDNNFFLRVIVTVYLLHQCCTLCRTLCSFIVIFCIVGMGVGVDTALSITERTALAKLCFAHGARASEHVRALSQTKVKCLLCYLKLKLVVLTTRAMPLTRRHSTLATNNGK